MAYRGYLLKVGNFEITGKRYINEDSYSVTRNVQDLDSYRDAHGVLHRNAISNVPLSIDFDMRPNLTNADIRAFFVDGIARNYTRRKERKCRVTAYVPELDDYVTQNMYMAGPEMKIKHIDQKKNVIYYDSFSVSFVGY